MSHQTVHVGPATREDVAAITDIYNEAVETTTASYDLAPVSLENRLAWFDAKVSAGWPVLAARLDGVDRVVGWSTYGPFREKAGYDLTVEHSVYVRSDCRGAGVGTVLLTPLIAHARGAGRHVMIGAVDADNAGSVAFHERHGFVAAGRLREVGRKFDRWLDVVYLQLTL